MARIISCEGLLLYEENPGTISLNQGDSVLLPGENKKNWIQVTQKINPKTAWSQAHELSAQNGNAYVEPDWLQEGGALLRPDAPHFPEGDKLDWHLDKTNLRTARETVSPEAQATIRIAHLDTGYDPNHETRPSNLQVSKAQDFFGNSFPTAADPGDGQNGGHGTATLAILAGNQSSQLAHSLLGGCPYAAVTPVRIANSVVHFKTSTMAQGLLYAANQSYDVVSLSMGGLPSRAWTEAVNLAYEKGVTMIAAAGNTFFATESLFKQLQIVWPARYKRVLAVCGIMANDTPYTYPDPRVMQGCFGPHDKMFTALSAYTPNIAWAVLKGTTEISAKGAGTSSATPQVAAAAALWLAKYKKYFVDRPTWEKSQATYEALLNTARNIEPFDKIGEGVLDANALLARSPQGRTYTQAEKDTTPFLAFPLLFQGAGFETFNVNPNHTQMLQLEMLQHDLTLSASEPSNTLSSGSILNSEPGVLSEKDRIERVIEFERTSPPLKIMLEKALCHVKN